MKTKKRQYLNACISQPVSWLTLSASNPKNGMTKMHVLLHYLAIRKKSGA